MPFALEGVKVVDLSHHIAGPYCTKLLADYGAEVVKIERPDGGDPARRMSPFFHDDPHPEKSGLFLHLNTNKKSITLNLKTELGKKIIKDLVRDADIVVENFHPRVMPSLGLDYPERYPSLIRSVTREDILRVAQTYLHPEKLILVVVGNLKEAGLE